MSHVHLCYVADIDAPGADWVPAVRDCSRPVAARGVPASAVPASAVPARAAVPAGAQPVRQQGAASEQRHTPEDATGAPPGGAARAP